MCSDRDNAGITWSNCKDSRRPCLDFVGDLAVLVVCACGDCGAKPKKGEGFWKGESKRGWSFCRFGVASVTWYVGVIDRLSGRLSGAAKGYSPLFCAGTFSCTDGACETDRPWPRRLVEAAGDLGGIGCAGGDNSGRREGEGREVVVTGLRDFGEMALVDNLGNALLASFPGDLVVGVSVSACEVIVISNTSAIAFAALSRSSNISVFSLATCSWRSTRSLDC